MPRAVGVILAPRRRADDLVGIVRAPLSGDEREGIGGIGCLLRRVEGLESVEESRNREMDLAILVLHQTPDLIVRVGTELHTGVAGTNFLEQGLTEREAFAGDTGGSYRIGLLGGEAVGGKPEGRRGARAG